MTLADPTPGQVTLACPAKLNLTLAVGPPRSDGMHPIASWMVVVRFADTLTLKEIEGDSTFDIHFADDAPRHQEVDWPLEEDLAFRAHALLQREADRDLPVAVTIKKRIPAGAGLGGGSSDAAAVMEVQDNLKIMRNLKDESMKHHLTDDAINKLLTYHWPRSQPQQMTPNYDLEHRLKWLNWPLSVPHHDGCPPR